MGAIYFVAKKRPDHDPAKLLEDATRPYLCAPDTGRMGRGVGAPGPAMCICNRVAGVWRQGRPRGSFLRGCGVAGP